MIADNNCNSKSTQYLPRAKGKETQTMKQHQCEQLTVQMYIIIIIT